MTPQEIIKEIQKLPPSEQQIVKASIENAAPNGETKTPMTEEGIMRMLYAEGIIGNIPDPSKYADDDDDWEPIEIKGKPASEIIIEDRG